MHLAHYLGLLHRAADRPRRAFREVADGARRRGRRRSTSAATLAAQCDAHAEPLRAVRRALRRGRPTTSPTGCTPSSSRAPATGGLGLLRDLQDLYLMAAECDIAWTLVGQAAKALRDDDLLDVGARRCESETAMQLQWLRTRMKQAAPQALVVA